MHFKWNKTEKNIDENQSFSEQTSDWKIVFMITYLEIWIHEKLATLPRKNMNLPYSILVWFGEQCTDKIVNASAHTFW